MIDKSLSISRKTVWSKRFMMAGVAQGAIIVSLTIFFVLSQVSLIKPEISRVIASGGAGTWFTFGYIMYIIVGVIGVAVSSLFYYYLESVMGIQLEKRRSTNSLAWTHLILMNVGTVAAMSMMMYGGYQAGASMLPVNVGGQGFNAGQAHEILAPFVEPISAAILILAIGVLAGGVGFLLAYRSTSLSSDVDPTTENTHYGTQDGLTSLE